MIWVDGGIIEEFDWDGNVAARPELDDAHGSGRGLPSFWDHMNSVAHNEKLDQIVLSVRGFNEIWGIDHGTTTQEAADHSGGKRGKGGDLLYRWGKPAAYKRGANRDKSVSNEQAIAAGADLRRGRDESRPGSLRGCATRVARDSLRLSMELVRHPPR